MFECKCNLFLAQGTCWHDPGYTPTFKRPAIQAKEHEAYRRSREALRLLPDRERR